MSNIIRARRKLAELYRTGVEVRIGLGDDGEPKGRIAPGGKGKFLDDDGKPVPVGDDEVALWIQPASPLQREQALRDAQGARAKALLRAKREKDSEEHLTVMAFLVEMDDEQLYEYVLASQRDERRQQAVRELLGEDEWAEVTTWQDAMAGFEENPPEEGTADWDDYQQLLQLDQKFGDEVEKRELSMRESALDVMRMRGRAAAEEEALKRRSEVAGSQAFMYEYEHKMLFFSVRDPDATGQLFFESARELAEQPEAFHGILQEALEPFISEVAEAKNSPGAASGSDSSELPNKPEISEASTPQEQIA